MKDFVKSVEILQSVVQLIEEISASFDGEELVGRCGYPDAVAVHVNESGLLRIVANFLTKVDVIRQYIG